MLVICYFFSKENKSSHFMIHMKCQFLFSLKKKNEQIKREMIIPRYYYVAGS